MAVFFFCQVWAPPGYIQNVVFYAAWGLPLTLNAEGDPSRLNCVPLGHGTAQLQGGGGIQARGLKTWLTEGPEREHFHSAMFRRHHQRNGPNQFPPTARVRPHLSSSLLLFSSFFLSLFFTHTFLHLFCGKGSNLIPRSHRKVLLAAHVTIDLDKTSHRGFFI